MIHSCSIRMTSASQRIPQWCLLVNWSCDDESEAYIINCSTAENIQCHQLRLISRAEKKKRSEWVHKRQWDACWVEYFIHSQSADKFNNEPFFPSPLNTLTKLPTNKPFPQFFSYLAIQIPPITHLPKGTDCLKHHYQHRHHPPSLDQSIRSLNWSDSVVNS